MPEAAPDFRLRAVITELDPDYIVSVSKMSLENDIEVVGEEEVATIQAAHDFIAQLARDHSCPSEAVEKLYNIAGRIANKPPKGRK